MGIPHYMYYGVSMSTPKRPTRPPMLLRLPIYALAHLGRIARDTAKIAFANEGLSLRAYFVLLCIDEHGGALSQGELADFLMMDRSDLVKVLDEIEQAQQIQRAPDRGDRRRHALSITPGGRKVLKQGRRIMDGATESVLALLGEDQRTALHQLALQALGESTPAARQSLN